MTREKKRRIEKMVKLLRQLDNDSLVLIKSGAEILKARQELERKAG